MSANSKQVAVRSASGTVAVPSEKTNRIKPLKKPLEEEEFTEALSTIIRRDFFPDTSKLEAQLEFIEATESNDYHKLREISERFAATTQTPAAPSATPATFETPTVDSGRSTLKSKPTGDSHPAADEPPDPKKLKPDEGKGVDEFLSKYQSEDDAAFGELMEKAKEQQRQKYAWLYQREEEAKANAMLEGPEDRLAITESGEGRSEIKAIDYRPASVKTWRYTPKNTLMYIPDGVEQSVKEKVEGASKDGKKVVHANTRLSHEFLRKTHAALVKGGGEVSKEGLTKDKVGVDGKLLGPAESPKVDGYGFVATPQIHPGVDASPLMTWGTIEGTPFRLETDITPNTGPSFKMPKTTKRELLAHRLADKANKANRERKRAAEQAASPALLRQKLGATPSASERLQLLSPAARKLVNRTTTPGSIHGPDKALKATYTPKRTPVGTPQHKDPNKTTPRHKATGGSTPSLTDNLLNLKNR